VDSKNKNLNSRKTNEDNFSKIKNLFLSSGIPLEASVSKKLQEIGYDDLGEPFSIREDNISSADIFCQKRKWIELSRGNEKIEIEVFLNFIIECKYRERNKKWFFMPFTNSDGEISRQRVYDSIYIIPYILNSWAPKPIESILSGLLSQSIEKKSFQKGVEILPSGQHCPIDKPIYQVMGASIDQIFEFLEREFDGLYHKDGSIGIFIPIVVTTAKLFATKDSLLIEDLENAEKIEDIANELDSIFIKTQLPPFLVKHTRIKFKEHFDKLRKIKMYNHPINNPILLKKYLAMENRGPIRLDLLRENAQYGSKNIAGRIFIINYNKLENEIKKIEDFYMSIFKNPSEKLPILDEFDYDVKII